MLTSPMPTPAETLPPPIAPATAPPDATTDRRAVGALSIGHFSVDFFQGCVPAIVPFLVQERGYSLAAIGALVFAFNLASSIVQPLFGLLADRRAMHWLIPLGLLMDGLAVGVLGRLQTPGLLQLAGTFGGIGVAAFHPEAARLVRGVSGRAQRARAMSVFATGGAAGFAVGPLVGGTVFAHFGLGVGSTLLLVPLALLLIYSVLELPGIHRAQLARQVAEPVWENGGKARPATAGTDRWGAFGLLCIAVMGRSIIFYGMSTFLAVYWVRHLGGTPQGGGRLVALLFFNGVLGALVGGWCGDRFGNKQVALVGFMLLVPLLFVLPHLQTPWALALAVALIGACLYAPYSVLVVLGQEFLPNHVGLASGVTLGLTITLGGLFTPVLGWYADRHGIPALFLALSLVPLLAVAATAGLPGRAGRTAA